MTVRNITWDEETDVVIVGCGGAGAVAAITASDAGAKVIVMFGPGPNEDQCRSGTSLRN
jgi:thioredoxin reductase